LPALLNAISRVSSKELVAAIAGKRNLHMLPRQARDKVRRQDGRIAKRLFHGAGQFLQTGYDIRLKNQFMVLGSKFMRDQPRILRLIKVRLPETDCESLDRF